MANNSEVNKPFSPLSETRITLIAPIICTVLVVLYAISTKAVFGQEDVRIHEQSQLITESSTYVDSAEPVSTPDESTESTPSTISQPAEIQATFESSENSNLQVWINGDEVPLPENTQVEQTISTPTGSVEIETSGTSDTRSSTKMRLNIRSESENDEEVRIKSRIQIDDE